MGNETDKKWDPNFKNHDILWDDLGLLPKIELKFGIVRKKIPLTKQFISGRGNLYYVNNYVELKGKWDNSPGFGSSLSLRLKNISKTTIRLTRLFFPAENGIDYFLSDFKPGSISFLRNGYQSWSTTRSYRLSEKPLRPWLSLVSLTSSNMANLPSNIPGVFSSEMYSLISNIHTDESFIVGQLSPFNQFLYIKLLLNKNEKKKSHFEVVYDFGRKMLLPGESIELDGILLAKGETTELQNQYFNYIQKKENIKILQPNIKGWSSWYIYFNKVTPEKVMSNVDSIKEKKIELDYIQLDDGYQKLVGDWLDLTPPFQGKMKSLADYIKTNGFKPGIWLAPFIADKTSKIIKENPDFLLRTEYGKPIICGYNPMWPGKFYYSIDITNRSVEEYIRMVIRTMVKDWGYTYLKLDFMFGACMRGGNHLNQRLSKAEVLKFGMDIIRDEAGKNTILEGCGMPISPGIGKVNCMRVGPDTAPYWRKIAGLFLQTSAMLGVKNSIRNFSVRSFMNGNLWINDPDCMILRTNTKLNKEQHDTQINAIILSGGMLMFSDDFTTLPEHILKKVPQIIQLSDLCHTGETLPLDLMESEIPGIIYNTNGILGIFNFSNRSIDMTINLKKHRFVLKNIKSLTNIWSGEIMSLNNSDSITLKNMKPFSSKLFKLS
ncbi:MAG: hypothetical protein A2015_08030 [Spirochaetes bacterium GWF1_31_7]|nr:MAG: hypothetical protein A2Y30_02120 [Spirochaetes bacterium GWE1_32_154]OHD46988.1 MAG: hypothetical protein A2015_08030 [Spirochaetes bacterium GWF1_31_7]OHD49768.1 MAG: hypothetical protein A2Y29_06230 [Spirochaetes bacterium GWE2_31_10]OHD77827.1 MAG: hypothetical protein A2355_09300 [Spirochaetes bacterium RIFOXYB1_FULL_32_8]HBD95502.1 hypothetical protein [Spirochaetia bacterium]